MKFANMLLPLLFFCLFCQIQPSTAQVNEKARVLYEFGLELKEAGETDRAIEAFKKAIDAQYKFPDAHYELALCYMNKKSVGYRRKADFAIDHALEFDKDNTKYLHAFGDLHYQKAMWLEARKIFERINKIDPEDISALDKIADYYYRQFYDIYYKVDVSDKELLYDKNLVGYKYGKTGAEAKLRNMLADIKIEKYQREAKRLTESKRIWDNKQWGVELDVYKIEFIKLAFSSNLSAVEYYDKILKIDPENRDARFKKGRLLYDIGDFDSFLRLYSEILERDESDREALMFTGLGYFEQAEYTKAYEFFARAIELLPPEDRAVFENIQFIHSDFDIEQWKETGESQNIDTTSFWIPKDPLFLTVYNERRLAHYGRVAEANLKYTVLNEGTPGWKTDRGRMMIRYGKPKAVQQYTKTPKFFETLYGREDGPLDESTIDQYTRFQFWYYDNFSFVFDSRFTNPTGNYELHNWDGINFEEVEQEVFEEFPEHYKYDPLGYMFRFPVDLVSFRGENFTTDANLYYGVPLNHIRMNLEEEVWNGTLEDGVFLFDPGWGRIEQQIDTTRLVFAEADLDTSSVNLYVLNRKMSLVNGAYNLGVELRDPVSGNTGSYRSSFNIEKYGNRYLQVSDLLIAHRIQQHDQARPLSLDNISIAANPGHSFSGDDPIFLYFEAYNLLEDMGTCRYRVDYIIFPSRERRNILTDLIWRGKQDQGISVSTDIRSSGRDDNTILIINHNITKPGDYILEVRITDLLSEKSVKKATFLKVF